MGGVLVGDEPFRFDFLPAFFAQAESAFFHAGKRHLDQAHFGVRGLLDCLKDFVLLPLRHVMQIAFDVFDAISQKDATRQQFFARFAQRVVTEYGLHGAIVSCLELHEHSPVYLPRQGYCVLLRKAGGLRLARMFSPEAQALMEAAIDAIVVIDQRGVMLAVNEAARRMFGYRSDELLGENVSLLMPEPDRSAHSRYLQAHLSTGIARVIGKGRDVTAKRKSGACFPAHLSVGRIPRCEPPRFVGFVRDDSEQARRDEDARATRERLANVSRLAMLGEMAAGIAHELNQPLTAISAYAHAAKRFMEMPQPDFAELQDAVREIGAESLRAGEIIRRMRALVRVDAGELIPADANAIVRDLDTLVAADARGHGVKMSYCLAGTGAHIKVDVAQIQQLLMIFVRNGFEALAAQPVGLREMEIATTTVDGIVEIRVTDNGPGISPDIADRLFDPFCTTKPHGTGLGLAISRTIAQAHGGTAGHRAAPPHGACFYVRLPAWEGPAT